jgi:hypothetical protein
MSSYSHSNDMTKSALLLRQITGSQSSQSSRNEGDVIRSIRRMRPSPARRSVLFHESISNAPAIATIDGDINRRAITWRQMPIYQKEGLLCDEVLHSR